MLRTILHPVPLFSLCIVGAISFPALSARDVQGELATLRATIEKITKQIHETEVQRDDVRRKFEQAEHKVARFNRVLYNTQSGIRAHSRKIQELLSRTKQSEQQLERNREDLENLIRSSYFSGHAEHLKLLLNHEDPGTLGRTMAYYRHLTAARAQDIQEIQALVTELQQLQTELEFEQTELKVLEAAQINQKQELSTALGQRRSLLEQTEQRLSAKQDKLSTLQKNAARLKRLLRDIKRALPAAKPPKAKRGTAPDQRFGRMLGKLSLPVSAPVGALFGQTKANSGMRWQGLFLNAEEDQEVRAIFQGRVAFADWLRGFGLLLILDHGDGYMSLYSHNKVLYKQVGEWADGEEPIARVGSSGGLLQPGLYFEIRHNGEPSNPLKWCKLQ